MTKIGDNFVAMLEDNGSSNKTKLNNRIVKPGNVVPLNGGAKMSFGKVNFQYFLGPSEDEDELPGLPNNGYSALCTLKKTRLTVSIALH